MASSDPCSESLPGERHELRDELVLVVKPDVTNITLFGSTARGDGEANSDIDILLSLKSPNKRPRPGLRWLKLEKMLSGRLSRRVELLS